MHLVDLAHDRALIAWGAFFFVHDDRHDRWEILDDSELADRVGRTTCIGHEAESFGPAEVEVVDHAGDVVSSARTSGTWAWLGGLEPETEYRYRVLVDGRPWAEGALHDWLPDPRGGYDLRASERAYDLRFTTWPAPEAPTPDLTFLAIGDYGVGIRSDSESSRRQRRVAEVLDLLVVEQSARFVLSLGDNIYQGELGAVDDESGGEDDDWYSSFFQPYRHALARVPFFPAIGNHDSTDSEGSDDRAQMEDNFHIAARFDGYGRSCTSPGLFYRMRFGRDLELVSIDTSLDSEEPGVRRHFQGAAGRWLDGVFSEPDVRWRIPFSHHPMYCAGPSHSDDEDLCQVMEPLLERAQVRLVLAGHEHNFQMGRVDGRTHVVSGAGGQVREHHPDRIGQRGVDAWAGQAHLLTVEVTQDQLRLTPYAGVGPGRTLEPMTVLDAHNRVHRPPFVVPGTSSAWAP